jgi:hypothetical protein
VPDKLETLMAELQAIDLWDREQGDLRHGIAIAGAFVARRMRRLEIIDEIKVLLNKGYRRFRLGSGRHAPVSTPNEPILCTRFKRNVTIG